MLSNKKKSGKTNFIFVKTAFTLLLAFPFCFPSLAQKQDTKIVLIATNLGNIKVLLYNQTPKHRDNFYKLASEGFYDSTLFHRVINGFMIQGGDPGSKQAKPGQMLGNGDIGYKIPAEINDGLFHKKGALAAARDNNPDKSSSGCQFYIVHGIVLTDSALTVMENRQNIENKQKLFQEFINRPENNGLKAKFISCQQTGKMDSLQILSKQIEPVIENEWAKTPPFKFTDKQRKAYTSIGGTPFLDGNYTVFGEVIEGLDVVDKIAAVQKNAQDRPLEDVRMKMSIVKK